MGRIASEHADRIIITADNSRSERTSDIISDIKEGIDPKSDFFVIEDRREAIEYAIKTAEAGDVIILAGKGHESYEICADGKHPFDERGIAKEALTMRRKIRQERM
jgi:UDP-N-acetylmuramoyl-L-alanyl-D-glutamate--2,6-diaminopimelate ligase